MPPQSPPLTVSGTVLEESDNLNILRVTFESKLTFEKYICSVQVPYVGQVQSYHL